MAKKPQIIYGRAMMVVKGDMPFITPRRYSFSGADLTADPASIRDIKPRWGQLGSTTIVADTRDDYYALCRVYDPGSHVYMDIAPVDPGAVLCSNMPGTQTLVIEQLQTQLASLTATQDLIYDSLPDPGSFVDAMTDHL